MHLLFGCAAELNQQLLIGRKFKLHDLVGRMTAGTTLIVTRGDDLPTGNDIDPYRLIQGDAPQTRLGQALARETRVGSITTLGFTRLRHKSNLFERIQLQLIEVVRIEQRCAGRVGAGGARAGAGSKQLALMADIP